MFLILQLQGLAYAILALICIIVYNDTPPNLPENSYMDMLNAFWYTFYLGRKYQNTSKKFKL